MYLGILNASIELSAISTLLVKLHILQQGHRRGGFFRMDSTMLLLTSGKLDRIPAWQTSRSKLPLQERFLAWGDTAQGLCLLPAARCWLLRNLSRPPSPILGT